MGDDDGDGNSDETGSSESRNFHGWVNDGMDSDASTPHFVGATLGKVFVEFVLISIPIGVLLGLIVFETIPADAEITTVINLNADQISQTAAVSLCALLFFYRFYCHY